MPIMAAKVCRPRSGADPVWGPGLLDGQGVQLASQQDGRARGSSLDDSGDTVTAEARVDLSNTKGTQFRSHPSGGFHLSTRNLWVPMQIATERDERIQVVCSQVVHVASVAQNTVAVTYA
ncbi:hypothetical protein JANAI62_28570 [Jannaschia pagri]|uniref:Uncharacterized protein n=1 Tax=Jannaschia pagri TaxID=2829797 RepID=A0ABQ4NPA9_9RHOB|nr:hypothetical protein JANAI61_28570 [Jannaschia sp. AI_61]GIT96234.1 hypothetical protein JANAI62_28570 [Jannaschia sp. AI_62]